MNIFPIPARTPGILKALVCVLLVAGLAACEDQPISALTPEAVVAAAKGGDNPNWETVRSKKVRWAGTVEKVVMIHGDDFVKEFYLRFDPGFGAGSGEAAIAEVGIDPSQEKAFKPGQAVTVTGIILSHEKETGGMVVKLGSGKVE